MDNNQRESETRALLEIVALGHRELENGEFELAEDYFARMRESRLMAAHNPSDETLALQAVIALGEREFDAGKGVPAAEVFAELRRKKGIDA